ncbi:MAG TPA: CatB-related O-acetyltransferase [Stellaceae bacterium]|nr:CatB-related O-acetyltransferase [Stellaceae bacterium]
MIYDTIYIEREENTTKVPLTLHGVIRLKPGARILTSRLNGPARLGLQTQIGPDVEFGRYSGMNDHGFVGRATIGNFCAFGIRNSFNPFNHPTDWLSTHEFQYLSHTFDWVDEYNEFVRLERTPDMFQRVTIGSDVWTGHHVNIMPGASVGDGAIIAAGAVVTKDVPPYAAVAGVPARVKRLRFPEKTIERLLRLRWWDLELSELSGLPFRDIDRCLDRIEEIRSRKAGERPLSTERRQAI